MNEFIYVLENPLMPGLVKIGRTDRTVSQRVVELSSPTGVPCGFVVVKEYLVEDSVESERLIHGRLFDCRVSDNREFFRIRPEDATAIIDELLESQKTRQPRDFEREDDLIARAIPIVSRHGSARARMLEEKLSISYEEALFVIEALRGRGLIGEGNKSLLTEVPELRSIHSPDTNSPAFSEEDFERAIEILRAEPRASVSILQRRLKWRTVTVARMMDELESRGVVGPVNTSGFREILIGAESLKNNPVSGSTLTQPNWVVCACEHCSGNLEFDAHELGDRENISVACPHCGVETTLSKLN